MSFEKYEGEEFSKLQAWGSVIEASTGRVCNFYQDNEVQVNVFGQHILRLLQKKFGARRDSSFRILDAGGGDGLLTEALIQILLDAGYTDFLVVNVDNGILMESAEERRRCSGGRISRHWENRREDLTSLESLPDNHFEAVVSRMVIQYATGLPLAKSNRPSQFDHLRQMRRVLRRGGEAIIVYPGSRSDLEHIALQLINSEILSQIGVGRGETTNDRFHENLESRSFTSIEELSSLFDLFRFKKIEVRELEEYKFTIPAEAYWDRFGKKNGFSLEEVQSITSEAEARYSRMMRPFGLELEYHPATGALVYPTIYARIRKENKQAPR